MSTWKTVLTLDAGRQVIEGSTHGLADAVGRGGDLRIYTNFCFNEHIDVASKDDQLVQEVSEFGVTYLIDGQWTAGVMSLRQPIEVPVGFGERPSMSFFLYNQDGSQAIARPHLDAAQRQIDRSAEPGPSPAISPAGMDKYRTASSFDVHTNAPSSNFVYEFGAYRFCMNDCWQEVLSHDADGTVASGSLEALTEAFATGCEIKVGIAGLCDDLRDAPLPKHETFVRVGPGYYLTRDRLFCAGTHPLVRIRPAIPMAYASHGWDFGWLMARSDGRLTYRRCDSYTLRFNDVTLRRPIRWFVR